ncbi:MAG: hypothetical protein V1707_00690 [bacterium]
MDQMMEQNKSCSCTHHKFVPFLIFLFGLLFLLGNLGVLGQGLVDIVWPILVLLGGLSMMTSGKCKCC